MNVVASLSILYLILHFKIDAWRQKQETAIFYEILYFRGHSEWADNRCRVGLQNFCGLSKIGDLFSLSLIRSVLAIRCATDSLDLKITIFWVEIVKLFYNAPSLI